MTSHDSPDAVDRIIEQWRREMPGIDLLPMELFGRVHRISQASGTAQSRRHAEYGIGRGDFDVLASLRRSGEPFTLAPKQISSTLMLTSGGLTGRLDKLEQAGLVERLPDPQDRRSLRIRLTDKGKVAVEKAMSAGLQAQRESLSALSAQEREILNGLLRKLHSAFTEDSSQ